MENWKDKSEDFWRQKLSEEEFHILREKGTERPFSGEYNDHLGKGSWHCKACDAKLFDGSSKFASSCGWPAFHTAADQAIEEQEDLSHGMVRQEVLCHQCGSHLGHVFPDGPEPTGLRYCINSLCLNYKED